MTAAQRLLPKLTRVSELGKIIDLHAERALPAEIRQEIENEQFRLEFGHRTLLDEFNERDADLKIKHMERVVELLKSSETNV